MSIAICFNNKDPKPWAKILQEKLPNERIEIYPDIVDFGTVTFALCWKADDNLLAKFPNLKVVQSVGASVDHVLNHQSLQEGAVLCRIVDDNLSTDMFEYILTGIMSHLKTFTLYDTNAKNQDWKPMPYQSIDDVTIGILGLGKIGSHVAIRLAESGFKVKGWARSLKEISKVSCYNGNEGLQKTLRATDILINILPYTEQTKDVLNAQNLGQLNQNAFLINVGRGEHLVEEDLVKLLDNNHLSGALLDVFRTEPLPKKHPFWKHEKIRITPHIAAITNVESASDIVVSNYLNAKKDEVLLNVVSISKGY